MAHEVVRPLIPADAAAYSALRREMLLDSPWAFASSPEDDIGREVFVIAAKLAEPGQAIVGAFDRAGASGSGDRLLGAAGLYRDRHIKMAHRARIWGVYVAPDARGCGLAREIVAATLDIARSWPGVNSVGLSCSERSHEALRLYLGLGFREWGVEPGALVLEGVAYDEIHMVAFLDGRH